MTTESLEICLLLCILPRSWLATFETNLGTLIGICNNHIIVLIPNTLQLSLTYQLKVQIFHINYHHKPFVSSQKVLLLGTILLSYTKEGCYMYR